MVAWDLESFFVELIPVETELPKLRFELIHQGFDGERGIAFGAVVY